MCVLVFEYQESLSSFLARSKRGEERAYILGRIVFIDSYTVPDTPDAAAAAAVAPAGSSSVASARSAGAAQLSATATSTADRAGAVCASNPYGLPVGTEYFVCYVEALKSLKSASSNNNNGGGGGGGGTGTGGSSGKSKKSSASEKA